MTNFKTTYILLIILFTAYACRQTKHVPNGKYLIKKNVVEVTGGNLDEDEVNEIIRQPSNYKSLGLRLKLRAYNMVDSSRVANKRIRKNDKIDRINANRTARQDRINTKRIAKAKSKGDALYTRKTISLKDSLTPKPFLREWLKYKYGEAPVIFDSTAFLKTLEQHGNYLKKKGYYFGENSGSVRYKKRRKKVIVTYLLTTGEQFIIDSVYTVSSNPALVSEYNSFLKQEKIPSLKNEPFDRDLLEDYRTLLAKKFRDETYYGFSATHISFIADTHHVSKTVILGIKFIDRQVLDPANSDSVLTLKHQQTRIRNVYFHISDTNYFDGNFKDSVEKLGLNLYEGQFFQDLDTLYFAEIKKRNSEELNPNREATFLYNGELFVTPSVIESQNYLEQENWYKEYYIERSYTRFTQLGLFQSVKPQLVEIPGTALVDVHYYLIPAQKQSFGFEPRASNSNGYFGFSTSINYVNKNLFGGAQKMTISLTGGFESQPLVFDATETSGQLQNIGKSFNTLNIGPSLIFDIPGLFPTKLTALSKRQRPRTVMSTAFNFQNRPEFKRMTFQANYLWKWYVGKTQVFNLGLPGASVIKFVNIAPSKSFEAKLAQLNDLFLRNSYSNQLIWQDWKFIFEYNNKEKDNKKNKAQFYYTTNFDLAGNTLGLFQPFQDTVSDGRFVVFGVPYSKFLRLDNDMIVSRSLTKKTSFHFRALAGAGIPNGNKQTSLPFDYSFFAGGSNDNRGWRARSLGPGSYKYMLDTNRTLTQIGDIRIGASAEYRFSFGPSLKGAIFMDAGNIWTYKEDINRPGSQISTDWFKEIAYSAGVGLRLDLDFFIVRLDMGIPLNNVSVPQNARWIFQSRAPITDELINTFGLETYTSLNKRGLIPSPFNPQFHFGIGYPF